jgi:hypothetical protein
MALSIVENGSTDFQMAEALKYIQMAPNERGVGNGESRWMISGIF